MDIHESHCSSCVFSSCSNTFCIIIKCVFCHVLLHQCKIEEHISEICRKAIVKCINSEYGCDRMLYRDKLSTHLQFCPASIVVCTRDRSRRICAKSCKLELKKLGKQLKETNFDENMDLDVKLAIHDQNTIIKSYNSSRYVRVNQRDPLNPSHPLLPLRKTASEVIKIDPVDEDSSEDERQERREKIRKSRMMFANCYMCQIDPSVQHLHTLGNGGDMERARKRRITTKTTDAFHDKFGLKISVDVESIPELSIKGENVYEIKKGGTVYTIKCLKTIKRCDYDQHTTSQHSDTVNQLDQLIVRCPNWHNGCEFYSKRIEPENGSFRLQVENDMITYLPNNNHEFTKGNKEDLKLDILPLWFYEEISAYLPTSALLNLSMVNRSLRENMFVGLKARSFVEADWKKTSKNEGWILDKFKWKFSKSERMPVMKWNVPFDLSHHIPKCQFFNPVVYPEHETMIPIFHEQYQSKIWNEFCDHLSERIFWEEAFQ